MGLMIPLHLNNLMACTIHPNYKRDDGMRKTNLFNEFYLMLLEEPYYLTPLGSLYYEVKYTIFQYLIRGYLKIMLIYL